MTVSLNSSSLRAGDHLMLHQSSSIISTLYTGCCACGTVFESAIPVAKERGNYSLCLHAASSNHVTSVSFLANLLLIPIYGHGNCMSVPTDVSLIG